MTSSVVFRGDTTQISSFPVELQIRVISFLMKRFKLTTEMVSARLNGTMSATEIHSLLLKGSIQDKAKISSIAEVVIPYGAIVKLKQTATIEGF